LGDFATGLTDELGGQWVDPGLKSIDRVNQKIAEGKAPGRINDVVRGSIVAKSPQHADDIVKRFGEKYQVADEGWGTSKLGYTDRKMLVRFPNGQVGEVQLHTPHSWASYKQSHDLYKQWRELDPDNPAALQLANQSRALNDRAWTAATPDWAEVARGRTASDILPPTAPSP
jgi:hypothetical protein